jgi:hypothetical protein
MAMGTLPPASGLSWCFVGSGIGEPYTTRTRVLNVVLSECGEYEMLPFGRIEGTRPIRLLLLREPMEPLLALLGVIVALILCRRYLKSHQAPAINEEAHPISLAPSTSGRDSTPAKRAEPPPMAGLAAVVPACIVRSRLVIKCDHCGKPAVPVHMPQVNPSVYCKDCCPTCSPQSGVRVRA